MFGALVSYGPNQAGPVFAGERKNSEEVGFIQVDMKLAIHRRTRGFYIGDIEDLPVGATRKLCAHHLSHARAGPIAAGDVCRFTALFLAARTA